MTHVTCCWSLLKSMSWPCRRALWTSACTPLAISPLPRVYLVSLSSNGYVLAARFSSGPHKYHDGPPLVNELTAPCKPTLDCPILYPVTPTASLKEIVHMDGRDVNSLASSALLKTGLVLKQWGNSERENIYTVPNALTVSRLLMTPGTVAFTNHDI